MSGGQKWRKESRDDEEEKPLHGDGRWMRDARQVSER